MVDQSSLLPSITEDPKLWMVKCVAGGEKEIVAQLMNKYISLSMQGRPLTIFSAFCHDLPPCAFPLLSEVARATSSDTWRQTTGQNAPFPPSASLASPADPMLFSLKLPHTCTSGHPSDLSHLFPRLVPPPLVTLEVLVHDSGTQPIAAPPA